MECSICRQPNAEKHLDIYAFGSEGVEVCTVCNNQITDYVRQMTNLSSRTRSEIYKAFALSHKEVKP